MIVRAIVAAMLFRLGASAPAAPANVRDIEPRDWKYSCLYSGEAWLERHAAKCLRIALECQREGCAWPTP